MQHNIFTDELEAGARGTTPWIHGRRERSVGKRVGLEELGVTLYVLPPDNANAPYHWHHNTEEALLVLSQESRRFGRRKASGGCNAVTSSPSHAVRAGRTRSRTARMTSLGTSSSLPSPRATSSSTRTARRSASVPVVEGRASFATENLSNYWDGKSGFRHSRAETSHPIPSACSARAVLPCATFSSGLGARRTGHRPNELPLRLQHSCDVRDRSLDTAGERRERRQRGDRDHGQYDGVLRHRLTLFVRDVRRIRLSIESHLPFESSMVVPAPLRHPPRRGISRGRTRVDSPRSSAGAEPGIRRVHERVCDQGA